MKIKSQFLICLLVFSIMLVVIAASVTITQQQVANLAIQEEIAGNIERGASTLNSVAIDYFLYQEDNLQLPRWDSQLLSLSNDLARLNLNPKQQTLANVVAQDLQELNALFDDVVTYLHAASRNVSVRIDPAFQARWSTMAIRSIDLYTHASQLSQSIGDQAHQANDLGTALNVSLIAAFGVFLATIYLIVFRRTLKSVAKLQKGINTIGSGNLEYVIETTREDEIGELSHSFNQMASDLKNVTASKSDLEQAQASLRESEQRWATTLASIGDAVIATDLTGRIMFLNGVAEELTGWTLNEASKKPVKEIFNIVNEQTRQEVENPVTRVLKEGMIVGLANHTILIRKDGAEIPIDDSGAPIKDKEGKTTGVVLVFRDITERKQMEAKLDEYTRDLERLVEERTKKLEIASSYARNLIEASPDPLVTISAEGKITDVNQATEAATGCSRKELIGSDFSDYFTEPEKAKIVYKQVFTEGIVRDYPLAIKNKSGRITEVLYNATVYKNDAGEIQGIFAAARDITQRKVLENLLKDSERLAAIGATAGMVGHDIRNPLQSIISDLYLAKSDLATLPESEEKQSINENLDEIGKSVEYVNKIVQDLQDFARPVRPVAKATDLGEAIEDQLSKIRVPPNIKVSSRIEKDAKTVVVDPDILRRIMANLMMNAVQAMPDGGKLTIHAYKAVDGVAVDVKDTGVGIPEDVKCKLFTPLFTTKSKGQGFGLAVVKRLTESLNGTVAFESQTGKGTTFTIKLPANKTDKP